MADKEFSEYEGLAEAEREKQRAAFRQLSEDDKRRIYEARKALESAWKRLKKVNEEEDYATMALTRSIDSAERLARLNDNRQRNQAATRSLRFIAARAALMKDLYQKNAETLQGNADQSDNLANLNWALAVCYFMVGLGKISDIFLQYYTGGLIEDANKALEINGKRWVHSCGATTRDLLKAVDVKNRLDRAKKVADVKTPLTDIGTEASKVVQGQDVKW